MARPLAVAALAGWIACTTAHAQTPIPASFSAPEGTIDLDESGFLVSVHQLEEGIQRDPRHDIDTVELQLAGNLLDGDGVPFFNDADLEDPDYQANDEGQFIVAGVINFGDDTDPLIGTIGDDGNFAPDEKYPGIPGFGNGDGKDDFAIEVLSFLELKAGLNRLGVNSADGFRFTIGVGTNTRDAFAVQPEGAVFEGNRGAANSEFELMVESDGIYPVRLIHWDGGGVSSIELYSVHPAEAGGERILVNDSSNANAVKAYRTATGNTPTATSVLPRPGSDGSFPRPTLSVQLEDGAAGIEVGSVMLQFDGVDVTDAADISKSGGSTSVRYLTPEFLEPNSQHSARLDFQDDSGASRSHTWQFGIANFVNLTADLSFPLDAKDESAPGFSGRVHQAREGAGLAASVERANAQVRGTLVDPFSGTAFANEATTDAFEVEGVINFVESLDAAEQPERGNFTEPDQADALFPGIPGSEGHDNQYAVELVTYLELPEGLYALGVNSQDGFELVAGRDARDVFDVRILGQAEGTRAVPEDDIMILNVAEAGLYSFRLVQFESSDDPIVNFTIPTDGGALEFFSLDPNEFAEDPETAQKILINDASNSQSIKAWRQLTVPERSYVASVSPSPDATAVAVTAPIEAAIHNLADDATVGLKVDGADVAASVSTRRGVTTVSYQPDAPLQRGALVSVELSYGNVSHQWSFSTSTGEVAMLVTNVGEKESDLQIKARLEQVFGFDVLLVDDDTVDNSNGDEGKFLIADAQALDVKLVYVASPVNSNKAGAQAWHTSGIPLINVEQADIDNFQYAGGGGGIAQGQTSVNIVASEHPIAAGFPAGEVVFTDGFLADSGTGSHHAGVGQVVEGDTVTVVAELTGGQAALVGFDIGTQLLDETVTTARMAHLAITGDDQFRSFNENGLKLFDALVAWVLGVDPPTAVQEPAQLNLPTFANGQVTLSWDGAGVLQTASSATGPWTEVANQSNPQTVEATGTAFFRVQQ